MVGTGVATGLLALTLQVGRYAEQVDGIAETIRENGEQGRENGKMLTRLQMESAAQGQVNIMVDKQLEHVEQRLAKVEGGKNAN